MAATGAEAVKLKPMGGDGESVLAGHFFLEPLDFFVFKFHDLLATGADEVVVVALVRDIVVLRLGAEVAGLRQACIAEQIQGAVDGGEPKVGIGLRQLVIHGFRRNVLLPEERAQDQFTLAGEFELMFAQVLLERLHFFYMRIRHDQASERSPLKTKLVQPVKGALDRGGGGDAN